MLETNSTQAAATADISVHDAAGRVAPGLEGLGERSFFRPRDAAEVGIDSRRLRRLVDDGAVDRVERGLYRRADAEITEHYTAAAVCTRIPNAIMCLLSALSFHDIGNENPREEWIAIPHKARAPRATPVCPIRVVRFSGFSLRYGVQDIVFEGVPARITSPARTIVDCFRFQRLIGTDVAIEAIRDALAFRRVTVGEILRTADMCRARSLVFPVLEVLTS